MKKASRNLEKVHKAVVLSFWAHVRKLGARVRQGDQAGFYEHLNAINLEGKLDRRSHFIKDEGDNLLRGVDIIHERMARWFHSKSLKLDPNITEGLGQWPENTPLRFQPTMQEFTDTTFLLPEGIGSNSLELSNIPLNDDPALLQRSSAVGGGKVPQQ